MCEEKRARGGYLRAGDRVALRSCLTGELLVLRGPLDGGLAAGNVGGGVPGARLCTAAEGQASAEAASWTVLLAGAPFAPR